MIEKIFSPPFIIIGMHRSGTSMLSELLNEGGIFMGNDLTNDKESRYFQSINTELLNQNSFSWISPGIPIKIRGIKVNDLSMIRHYVAARRHPLQLLKLLAGSAWGWKDPRNTFTLDYWLKIFPNAKVIHIYRNGMDVALSLFYRNIRLGKEDKWYESVLENKLTGLDLWEKYISQAFSYQPLLKERMLTIQFEKLIAGNLIEIKKIETFTKRPLHSLITKNADKEKTQRYLNGEHDDLIQYAQQNYWMKKLYSE